VSQLPTDVDIQLVRKEFKPLDENQSAYETELRNLSILKLLRHPNIVEVLSCYAYLNKLNLVFPRAQGGTVKDLLKGPRPKSFVPDEAILVALSGLCSAVHAVHQFISCHQKLELIGCHHDLKPANILVEGSRFVLADFGLSRFKEASESSGTPLRTMHPYYAPPECFTQGDGSEKPEVHRSVDIWSLGCIIAEVITYMLDGAEGVENFRTQRAHTKDSVREYRFHHDGAEDPVVAAWITKLQRSASRTERLLGQLVGQMLQLHHQDRPKAQEVELKMNFVAIDAISQQIRKLYDDVCDRADSIQPALERTRFDSWRYSCGILESSVYNTFGQWNENVDYPFVYETLTQIQTELEAVLVNCANIRSRIFVPLRELNDLLIGRLSHKGQNRARLYLDTQILLTPSDKDILAKIGERDSQQLQDQRLSILVTVKCMNEILQKRPVHSGSIDRKRLERKSRVGSFTIETLRGNNREEERQVLVESKIYQQHYADSHTAKELQERLEYITDILKEANRARGGDSFRVLPCVGFYQDLSAFSCGLVYEFPISSKELKFTTLRTVLEESRNNIEQRPSLEQRFHLAQALASSVLKFHTVSWLQKSISSFNIVFFHPANEPWLEGIADPFFLGFLYSRNNDENAFTEGPAEDASFRDYQHPDYRRRGRKGLKYRAEYDYYSLGLVLLEIGLWRTIDNILKWLGPPKSQPQSQIDLFLTCLSRLRLEMGTRYQQTVETCLRGDFGVPSDVKQRDQQLLRSFSTVVVERLAECRV
jgi:serine/threonine protein kinase